MCLYQHPTWNRRPTIRNGWNTIYRSPEKSTCAGKCFFRYRGERHHKTASAVTHFVYSHHHRLSGQKEKATILKWSPQEKNKHESPSPKYKHIWNIFSSTPPSKAHNTRIEHFYSSLFYPQSTAAVTPTLRNP